MSLHDAYLFELERLVQEYSSCTVIKCEKLALSSAEPNGTIIIDSGASQAISQKAKGLLPVGVVAIDGVFEQGSVVVVVDSETKRKVSKGRVNYSSMEIQRIIGKHSRLVGQILGKENVCECVISKQSMILV
jgi:glutamate 5-kinase